MSQNRQTDKQKKRQTEKQKNRQADRQTDVILIKNKVARPQFKNNKFCKPCETETFIR